MKRIVFFVILLILAAGAGDLMRQRGWINTEPSWLLLGIASAFGVVLGRWLRDDQR